MLTQRRQEQALADLIYGLPVDLDLERLTPKHKKVGDHILYVIGEWDLDLVNNLQDRLDLQQELHRFKDISGNEEARPIIDRILSLDPGRRRHYESLAEIGPGLPEVQWLWRNWIPRRYLTLLAAAPGVGKSYFALDLAYRLINGLPAPDGQSFEIATPAPIIYVDAEDFLPVLYQRVKQWGMDMSLFFPFQRPARSIIDLADRKYQDELIDMIYDLRPGLVAIDSLSRVNRRGENSIEEIRDVLDIMVEIPMEFDLALILTHHLRKKPTGHVAAPVTIHDIRGSGDLIAASRVVLGLDALQTDQNGEANGPRRFKVLKTNLCPHPDPMAVNFRPIPHAPDYVRLEYNQAALYELTPRTKQEECIAWLIETLTESPRTYEELKEMVDAELGFNETVLQRARKLLGTRIIDTLGPRVPGNQWALAEEAKDNQEDVDEQKESEE